MKEILEIPHEDILERKCVLLWSSQVRWIKENEINLSSLLRTILQKEIRRHAEEVQS